MAPTSVPEGIGRLVRELRLGVLLMNRDGLPVFANGQAERALQGATRGTLLSTLQALRAGAGGSEDVVEARIPTGRGATRVLLVRTKHPRGFAACLDADTDALLRAEIGMLRSMLETVAQAPSPRDALSRTLSLVAASFPNRHVLLYQVDRRDRSARPVLPMPFPAALAALDRAHPLDGATAVGRAVTSGQPVHVSHFDRSPFEADRALVGMEDQGSVTIPVGARRRTLGALMVIGRLGSLSEGDLGLLYATAHTVGALLHRAEQENTLELAREDAVRRERLAALGRLAAGVSHEVSNPLSFIAVNLALLGPIVDKLDEITARTARPGGDEIRQAMAEIREIASESMHGVDRLKAITQALRGVAREDPRDRKPFDPGIAIRDAVHLFRSVKRASCEVRSVVAPLRAVKGSIGELGQVILNLLENGLHAMGNRGTLTVTGEMRGDVIRLSVADRGSGIHAEVQPHIFDPFFTTKPVGEGTGLGLYICHEIISRMGGALGFDTGPEGTTFHIDIPAAVLPTGP